MRKPKLRELWEAIKILLVRGPYTSSFPAKPYLAPKEFRGKPEYDNDLCVGCGACAKVCPARAIEIIDDPETAKRKLVLHYDICIYCGQCHRNCTTTDGIALGEVYDLATLDRSETVETVEKDLVICEHCGEIVGARDHLLWLVERLGAQAYANPTLLLVNSARTSAVPAAAPRDESLPGQRSDLMRILCPSCRRDIFMTEEWK